MKEEKAAPDLALVLSGGGARAAYQVGVLCAIAERRPALSIPIYAGVSAGAINTITLAAHPGTFAASVRAVRRAWSRLTVEDVYEVRMTGLLRAGMRWVGQRMFHRGRRPTVVRGVFDMEPLRHFLEQRVDVDRIDENVRTGKLHAVTLSATCYDTGETVTFVHGAPDVPVWERSQRRAVRTKLTIDHVLATQSLEGAVNTCAPSVPTNAEFTKALGRALSRPTLFWVPALGLRILFGEVSDALLAGQRMDSSRLQASGFEFQHPDLQDALRNMLGRS